MAEKWQEIDFFYFLMLFFKGHYYITVSPVAATDGLMMDFSLSKNEIEFRNI